MTFMRQMKMPKIKSPMTQILTISNLVSLYQCLICTPDKSIVVVKKMKASGIFLENSLVHFLISFKFLFYVFIFFLDKFGLRLTKLGISIVHILLLIIASLRLFLLKKIGEKYPKNMYHNTKLNY